MPHARTPARVAGDETLPVQPRTRLTPGPVCRRSRALAHAIETPRKVAAAVIRKRQAIQMLGRLKT
jgi:hypothetical protein